MYFLQGARRAEILTECILLHLTKNNAKRYGTKHFRDSYRLQSAGTDHARALRLRKKVVDSVQNHWETNGNHRFASAPSRGSVSAR